MVPHVRESNDIPELEYTYLFYRTPKVKAALEKLLEMKLEDDDVPIIAFCASGGGYRSMLATAGFIAGAEDLIDGSVYFSSLSGSTWFLGPWLLSVLKPAAFAQTIPPKITQPFVRVPAELGNLVLSLIKKLAYKQPISPLNLYGRLLALDIMQGIKNGPFGTYIFDQTDQLAFGNSIFPIYTAVATKLPYQWVEFTPYEMGGDYFGGYIPVWAFGSPFLDGARQYYTPPLSFHYILAIAGSAFAARLSQSLEEIGKAIPVEPIRKALIDGAEILSIGKYRAFAAKVFNWTYGMKHLPRAQQKVMSIIDGGIAYNLPLETLLRRKANIIIILDNSASTFVGEELQKAQMELRARGFAFPHIDYTNIATNTISVFKDPTQPTAPVILYMPLIKNPSYPLDPQECLAGWCGTFSLQYPEDKSQLLMGLTRKNMEDAKPIIIDEIKKYILSRR